MNEAEIGINNEIQNLRNELRALIPRIEGAERQLEEEFGYISVHRERELYNDLRRMEMRANAIQDQLQAHEERRQNPDIFNLIWHDANAIFIKSGFAWSA